MCSALVPRLARAQLGPDGAPITTNDYAIDTYQGPVLASTRVIGLAGAYVAVGEFVEGNTQNPAAPAVRPDYGRDHVDYDIGVGFTFPGTITGTDFFNTGKSHTNLPATAQDGFVFFELSGNLQLGPWGIGGAGSVQQYGLESSQDSSDKLRTTLAVYDVQLARAFYDGQLLVGLGARLGSMNVFNTNSQVQAGGSLFQSFGVAPELGALFRPNGQNYRLGLSFRAPLESGVANQSGAGNVLYPDSDSPLYLPSRVTSPWQLGAGAAYRAGRTFNPEWIDPADLTRPLRERLAERERERQRERDHAHAQPDPNSRTRHARLNALDARLRDERARDLAELARVERETRALLGERFAAMNRHYLLISTAVFLDGPVENAVGIESFFERIVNRSGQEVTVSPRLGVESEVIPYWLIVRAGTYLEPTRFASNEAGARLHATTGFDVRLGAWNVFGAWPNSYVWRLRTSFDAARDYFNWGLAIGGFY
ncbi:MAG TPA: hypothetical protein VLC09_19835 [Polyangiaceae bacterium]|nr:hypothetical protein [Polyangiaceae bacterium]